MTIHKTEEGGKPIALYDPQERNAASVEAELRGQRKGYSGWKPDLNTTVSVRAIPGENVWERHGAHEQAGHVGGEVLIAQDILTVALTPLVCQKLEAKVLREATPNQIEMHQQKADAGRLAAAAAFKERCREEYQRLTGTDEGFEAAFPKIREKKFLDHASAA